MPLEAKEGWVGQFVHNDRDCQNKCRTLWMCLLFVATVVFWETLPFSWGKQTVLAVPGQSSHVNIPSRNFLSLWSSLHYLSSTPLASWSRGEAGDTGSLETEAVLIVTHSYFKDPFPPIPIWSTSVNTSKPDRGRETNPSCSRMIFYCLPTKQIAKSVCEVYMWSISGSLPFTMIHFLYLPQQWLVKLISMLNPCIHYRPL